MMKDTLDLPLDLPLELPLDCTRYSLMKGDRL